MSNFHPVVVNRPRSGDRVPAARPQSQYIDSRDENTWLGRGEGGTARRRLADRGRAGRFRILAAGGAGLG